MKNLFRYIASAILLLTLSCGVTHAQQPNKERFEVGDGAFMLNGKPFVIKAAELHYPRIPRPYWEQRIELCKALGMNTVCLYVFWNAHESHPDVYDFSEQLDLAEFCRLCQKHGLYVILRPGPYVCAEWEMGGLPWWLLKKKDIRLRENDSYFLERVDAFEKAVAEEVRPMLSRMEVRLSWCRSKTNMAHMAKTRRMSPIFAISCDAILARTLHSSNVIGRLILRSTVWMIWCGQ